MDLKFYLSLFLRRLHWCLLCLVAGSATGLTLAMVLPPTYSANATLVVESEQIPSDLAETTVRTEVTEALQIIRERILTRSRLIEMANRLGIYDAMDPELRRYMSADEVVIDLRERITIASSGGPATRREPAQATILRVGFEAASAQLAATVANEIVTMILQENVALRTAVASQTLEFFKAEVDRLDRELVAQGAEILAFRETHLDALPDSLDFRRGQQSAAQERLAQVERAAAALQDRRDGLEALRERAGEMPMPQSEDPAVLRLAELRQDRARALAVLSPQNPRLKLLDSQIAMLEQELQPAGAEAGGPLSMFEMQLADIDAQMGHLDSQRAQAREEIDRLQATIEATPGNAIRLEAMQRDHAALRARYDQALASRARAETGDTIEALAKGQRISVVEPAVPPDEPDSPNRPVVAAAGILGGLALGIGAVLLLEMTSAAVRRPEDLVARLGITPFATLPYIRTRAQARRRQAALAALFAGALVGLPAGLWWVHTEITPLDLLLDRAVGQLALAAA
ncbi:GumC family protein [Limimaricola pyoseonensis]|uniref:Uncharacterized protein involved in exopolysaccharide biosynthesis n=1 Tax=Limimaricola pyoseonensis TaxID=521013 RepID=A0A1G7IWQ1_9RHOB|nr:Wzz/FepE/Etk N-terminal domain-containing protein [Limimaricola pyoseonensis]SDF17083.1 Uncharacterized protein involved in exopolysaccharide biosynthesis [Limimaricola pyoseonensis]